MSHSVITASLASDSCYLPSTTELNNDLMSAELSFKYSFPQFNRNGPNYKWSQTPQFNRIDLTSIKGGPIMPVMIPMIQTFQWEGITRVSGESESRMLWGGVVKELRAPVIWSRLTFMEHFQSWTMFRNFVSHPVSTFIRIKDSRPSKTLFSRNALKWVFIQILSVSQWMMIQTPDSMSVDCWSKSRQNMAQVWPKTLAKDSA